MKYPTFHPVTSGLYFNALIRQTTRSTKAIYRSAMLAATDQDFSGERAAIIDIKKESKGVIVSGRFRHFR